MKTEEIKQLFEQSEQACYIYKDVECWSSREYYKTYLTRLNGGTL